MGAVVLLIAGWFAVGKCSRRRLRCAWGCLKPDNAFAGIGDITLRADVESKLSAMNGLGEHVPIFGPSPNQKIHLVTESRIKPIILGNMDWRHVDALLWADHSVKSNGLWPVAEIESVQTNVDYFVINSASEIARAHAARVLPSHMYSTFVYACNRISESWQVNPIKEHIGAELAFGGSFGMLQCIISDPPQIAGRPPERQSSEHQDASEKGDVGIGLIKYAIPPIRDEANSEMKLIMGMICPIKTHLFSLVMMLGGIIIGVLAKCGP
jgi:hypothetical protein